MKSICMLVVVLLLCGPSIGDSSYNNPPYGYGPPPPPPSPPQVCYTQDCTDYVVITKPDFLASVHLNTVTNITPYPTHTISYDITPYSTEITKTVCESTSATTIYQVFFDAETYTSTYYHTYTEYIPRTKPVTINQCVGSMNVQNTTVTGFDVHSTQVDVTSFSFSTTTQEVTAYTPTSSVDYLYLCTETMKCEQGYSQRPYY